MFISELFPNDLEEAKVKTWCPIEDSDLTGWPDYGKTKDGRKSIKTEVDNDGDYRNEVESHGWVLDHSSPVDPGYPVYVNKNSPGEELHIIPDGYGIGNYHATVILVTNKLDEFAPTPGGEGDDDDEIEKLLQLYISIASKINVRRFKPSTARRKIAELVAKEVPIVSDDFVDFAYQVARKRQGMPNSLDSHNIEINELTNGHTD